MRSQWEPRASRRPFDGVEIHAGDRIGLNLRSGDWDPEVTGDDAVAADRIGDFGVERQQIFADQRPQLSINRRRGFPEIGGRDRGPLSRLAAAS